MGLSYRLNFLGFIQPPTVPPDPTGDSWRGIPGPPGQQGPPGPSGTGGSDAGPLPTSPVGLAPYARWDNGGVVCIVQP
jgi:hypothetical protein